MSSPTLAPTVTTRTSNPPSVRGTKTTRLRFSSCTATCGIRMRSARSRAACVASCARANIPGLSWLVPFGISIRTSTVRVVSEMVAPMYETRPETG